MTGILVITDYPLGLSISKGSLASGGLCTDRAIAVGILNGINPSHNYSLPRSATISSWIAFLFPLPAFVGGGVGVAETGFGSGDDALFLRLRNRTSVESTRSEPNSSATVSIIFLREGPARAGKVFGWQLLTGCCTEFSHYDPNLPLEPLVNTPEMGLRT